MLPHATSNLFPRLGIDRTFLLQSPTVGLTRNKNATNSQTPHARYEYEIVARAMKARYDRRFLRRLKNEIREEENQQLQEVEDQLRISQ